MIPSIPMGASGNATSLQGIPVTSATPSLGRILKYDGNELVYTRNSVTETNSTATTYTLLAADTVGIDQLIVFFTDMSVNRGVTIPPAGDVRSGFSIVLKNAGTGPGDWVIACSSGTLDSDPFPYSISGGAQQCYRLTAYNTNWWITL